MSEWISVKDRLPKKRKKVLLWNKEWGESPEVDKGFMNEYEEFFSVEPGINGPFEITHWIPLLAPPKHDSDYTLPPE